MSPCGLMALMGPCQLPEYTTPSVPAIGSMFTANIGDATPHGQANERVMKGVVKWMKKS